MKDVLTLALHLLTTIAKLIGPGGARAVVADSLPLKQHLFANVQIDAAGADVAGPAPEPGAQRDRRILQMPEETAAWQDWQLED